MLLVTVLGSLVFYLFLEALLHVCEAAMGSTEVVELNSLLRRGRALLPCDSIRPRVIWEISIDLIVKRF